MTAVLGLAPKPPRVFQRQFDGCDEKLTEMAAMDWDRIPSHYFWYYFLDLAYVDLQPDLFQYLFPACLKYWYDTLMGNEAETCDVGDFAYALIRSHIPDALMTPVQRQALFDFVGIIAPVIQPVWNEWWALDHSGKAVCAVTYASGLV